jgi:CRISPR-associated protein Cmr4
MRVRILQAVTSVHVGDGTAMGAVDLPVVRESQTGWPTIAGSSCKGALRQRARFLGSAEGLVIDTFGAEPPDDGASDEPLQAGRVAFGPAVLLALPVRSLAGGFVLMTCSLALGRLARALGETSIPPLPVPAGDEALLAPKRLATFGTRARNAQDDTFELVLEDLDWVGRGAAEVERWAELLKQWLGQEAPLDHLAVVHDDLFSHACRTWLPVRTRAKIDVKTGVVEDGALFTAEEVPTDTLWWTWTDGDRVGDPLPGHGEVWIVGGLTTIGMGRVAWYQREVADAS